MMAGRREDWNSQPHRVTSVSLPAGSILGKNCRQKKKKSYGITQSSDCNLSTIASWFMVFFEQHGLANQFHLAAYLPLLWQVRMSVCSTARHTHSASSRFPNTSHSSWSVAPSNTGGMSWNVHTPVLQRAPWTSRSGRTERRAGYEVSRITRITQHNSHHTLSYRQWHGQWIHTLNTVEPLGPKLGAECHTILALFALYLTAF